MAMSVTYENVAGQLVYENRGGVESYYVPDTLGSTVALQNSSGVVTDTYDYWSYGEERTHTGSSGTPFTFVGTYGYYQDNLGRLNYVRARYLNTQLAQWLTHVRISEFLVGEHPYSYAFNNPLGYADSSGNAPCLSGAIDPCDKYPEEPGFWGSSGFSTTVSTAIKATECDGLNSSYLKALLRCIVEAESRDHPRPYQYPTSGESVQGPCQIWPGSDKTALCGKKWQTSQSAHMLCCAKILCKCILSKQGNIIRGCGTTGSGKHRKGQYQTINESGPGYTPRFKCCLKRQGLSSPSKVIPTSKSR